MSKPISGQEHLPQADRGRVMAGAFAVVLSCVLATGGVPAKAQNALPAPANPSTAPSAASSVGPSPDPLAHRFGGAFSLTAPDGRRVTEADLRGRYSLVTFGYTHCPDVCPTDLAAMAQAIDDLGERGAIVQPIFVTVDPARDTPEILAEYAASFHPRLLALGGSEAEVAAAAKAYKVHRRKVLAAPGQTADYLVDHSSLIYLMGPDGAFLTLFPANTPADRMAAALKTYLP